MLIEALIGESSACAELTEEKSITMSSEPIRPDVLTRIIIVPTPEEDAEITAAALSDPDALPFSDAELAQIQPKVPSKTRFQYDLREQHTLLLDAHVVAAFRAAGDDWEERINKALIEWAGEHGILPRDHT
jgi:uncharacterized protein (DUF4415 family)